MKIRTADSMGNNAVLLSTGASHCVVILFHPAKIITDVGI